MIDNTVNDVQNSVVENSDVTEVNASAEGVVDLQNEEADTSVVDNQPSGEAAKPRQSSEDNSRFAEMRRESERHQREYNSLKDGTDKLLKELKNYGFAGDSIEEITNRLKAQSMGVEYDDYMQSETAKKEAIEEAVKNHPTVKAAEEYARQTRFEKDLAAIKAAYPECKADSVLEIGEVFVNAMAGGLSPEDAYAAQLAHDNRTKQTAPPKIGELKQTAVKESDTFTEEELNYLNSDAGKHKLKDPKILAKALRSMYK